MMKPLKQWTALVATYVLLQVFLWVVNIADEPGVKVEVDVADTGAGIDDREYFNKQGLTLEHFITHNFKHYKPSTRVYMTEGKHRRSSGPIAAAVAAQPTWDHGPPATTTHAEAVHTYNAVSAFVKEKGAAFLHTPISDFILRGTIFPEDIQKFLMKWYRAKHGMPGFFGLHLKEYMQHLKLLTERPFAETMRNNSCNSCFNLNFSFPVQPPKCRWDEDLQMVVLVTSVPMATEARMAIRNTWGMWSHITKPQSKVIFLFGAGWTDLEDEQLKEEALVYGDILQANFKDHYYNLTYKVLAGYKWVTEACPSARFILRAADDTFVYLPNINALLTTNWRYRHYQNFQMGLCFPNYKPIRFPWYKNHVTNNEYPLDHYPPYAHGTAFIVSKRLVIDILQKAKDIPPFPLEDAYLGIVLARIGSGCHHLKGFSVPATEDPVNQDYFFFSSHSHTPVEFKIVFKKFMDFATHRKNGEVRSLGIQNNTNQKPPNL